MKPLIPMIPAVAIDHRVDALGADQIAFRSSRYLHMWSGSVFRDVGMLLHSGLSAGRIVARLERDHEATTVIGALHQFARCSLLRQWGEDCSPLPDRHEPETFGPFEAPYRTCVKFLRRPRGSLAGETAGYYVYGKGTEVEDARIGCEAEAVERQSLYSTSDDSRVTLSHEQIRTSAVLPSALLPPGECGVTGEVGEWTPVYSLTSKQTLYLPSAFCYFGVRGWHAGGITTDTNGCAAGVTVADAALHGFFEVIERDALRRWWGGESVGRNVRAESFERGLVADTRQYLGSIGRSLILIDIPAVAGVSVFVALSFMRYGRGVLGAAAHFNPQSAIRGAVLELGLALNWAEMIRVGPRALTPEMICGPGGCVEEKRPREASDYPEPECAEGQAGLDRAIELTREGGREFLFMDMTRPGAAYRVVRITIPGLFHFNPGTMYRMVPPEHKT